MRQLLPALMVLPLIGCGADLREIGREPALSPSGASLPPHVLAGKAPGDAAAPAAHGSLWNDRGGSFFRDPRARQISDIITIVISIDDRAKIDGTFDRSKTSSWTTAMDFLFGANGLKREGNVEANLGTTSKARGQGTVNRAETIKLSLAAVVSEVLPNGNLVIRGSQEIRVNYELRVLQITGVVRPGDISKDNTVPYDKIAEARISYGGRGRVMEVQQPGVGQQFLDRFYPF